MGILDALGAGKTLAAPIEAVGNVLDKLVTTDKDRENAEQVMTLINQNPFLWQATLNQLNAQSGRWFESSWRPLCGYVCAFAMAWTYLLQPIFQCFLLSFHINILLPRLNTDELMPLLYGMLGLGGFRTFEKINSKK